MRAAVLIVIAALASCDSAPSERSDIASATVAASEPSAQMPMTSGSICPIPTDVCADVLGTSYPFVNRTAEQDQAADAQFERLLSSVIAVSQNCPEPSNMNYLNVRQARSQTFRNSDGQQLFIAIVGNNTCYTGGVGGVFVNGQR